MAKDKKAKTPAIPEDPDSAAPPKKSRVKRIVIILVILIMMLTGAGAGAYWWFFIRTPGQTLASLTGGDAPISQSESESATATSGQQNASDSDTPRIERPGSLPRSNGIVLPLPPVTVNLADANGQRYLKLGMEVEANADIREELKAQAPRIRDAIIMLLAGKSFKDVSTPDGKVLLKAEVGSRLNQILGNQRIIRVYFTDFVVQ